MRALVVVLLVISYLPFVTGPQAATAADCEFVMGFKTVHDVIPDIVGDCKVNQHYNSQNGDGLQETAGGLLVWRKADNFTAFTDGYYSWVNGPYGLQQRLNTESFDWEKRSVAACAVSASNVTFDKFVGDNDGFAVGEGKVHNPCGYPLDAIIDVFGMASKDGPLIIDAPSVFVRGLAPGETRTIRARVPFGFSATWFNWKLADVSAEAVSDRQECSGANNDRCLSIDRWLTSAIRVLERVKEGEWLLKVAAENQVRIARGDVGVGILGYYNSKTKIITIDNRLDAYSSWVRAAVLSHELQHAVEDATGQWPDTSAECYRAEQSAFRRQAQVWSELWQNRLPSGADILHQELNEITLGLERDQAAFTKAITPYYKKQCGG